MNSQKFVGRVVQVQFIAGRNGLAAVSSEFAKIAFLKRQCKLHDVPVVGEEWKCLITGDSKPDSERFGALFVAPLRKLTESIRWTLEDRPDTGVSGMCCLKVIRKVMVGNKLLSAQEFFPADITDISVEWPDWVQKCLKQRIEDLRKATDSIIRGARAVKLLELKKTAKLKFGVNPEDGYPFQWVGDWLTNGVFWFPRLRPFGAEWRDYPVPSIPDECWQLFLEGLEGKVLVELIPFHRQIVEQRSRQAALTARQKKVAALVTNQMWSGNGECKRVSVGRNMIFVATRASGPVVHIVDNPGKGALYVFDEYADARALADGSTTRTAAIKSGAKRVLHRTGWQAKVAALLQ